MIRDPRHQIELIDGSWLNHRWLGGEIKGLLKDGLPGWYDSLSPRDSDPDPIPQMNGSYWPALLNVQHRIVTIRGVHRAGWSGSSLQITAFRDLLVSMVGEPLLIEVEDQAGLRRARGFVSAQIPLDMPDGRTTTFSLIITCLDPLKYGPAVLFSPSDGGVLVENNGTSSVAPVFVVSGLVSRFTASLGGQKVAWAGPTGDGLLLDAADGLPMRGGVVTGTLTEDDFFKVPPGQSQIGVSSDGQVQIEVSPGWL
jgi:hypothetical protein